MCGIYASTDPTNFGTILDAMKHRGPDSQHTISHAGFLIGFNRLAIVDTHSPEAEQPYCSSRGSITVFNGEIYNYKRLDPSIGSEVALIANMIDEGLDVRQFFDGDYAILHFNPSTRLITLYRDRFGVCPLYYQLYPYVAVSSEARRLQHPREVLPHQRVVIGIWKSPPAADGYMVEHDVIKHYGLNHSFLSLDTMRQLFLSAVVSRAVHTDSGFSTTCSGGLDSSVVLYALKALGLSPAALLCVSYGETEDLFYARQVAKDLGTVLTEIQIDETVLAQHRPYILEHMDMPKKKITGMNWRVAVRDWFVAMHSPTKVVLTGEGSDELFEGYPPHPDRLKIPYRIAHKQLGALQSLPHCSLYLSNKIGLAHSREFRAPFLQSTLSYVLLASNTGRGKGMLRQLLASFGAPEGLVNRGKWGTNEVRLDGSLEKI